MRTIVKVKQVFRNIKNQMFLIENLFSDLDVDLEKEYSLELKEVKSNEYNLSINRYKEIEYKEKFYHAPSIIFSKIKELEKHIIKEIEILEKMVSDSNE